MTDPWILDVLGFLIIIDTGELLGILDVLGALTMDVLARVDYEGNFSVLGTDSDPSAVTNFVQLGLNEADTNKSGSMLIYLKQRTQNL